MSGEQDDNVPIETETKKNKKKLQTSPNPTPGFNLAGKPGAISNSFQKKVEIVVVHPSQSSSINTANYWSFNFRLRKGQWGRLKSDSLSMIVWGRQNNPNRNQEAGATLEQRSEVHALRARTAQPEMFVDPSVQGTGFVKNVEVFINNVNVPTNGALSNHILHYVRMNRIFSDSKENPYFATTNDIDWTQTGANMGAKMRHATNMFDYEAWNNPQGVRVPIYLDGIFPFDFKNRTLEVLDKDKEPSLFFPPETSIEIRIHLHRDKIESIFHSGMDLVRTSYFEEAAAERPRNNLMLTIQDVSLEYEVTELIPEEHVKTMTQFQSGAYATYLYDIPRCQFQALLANQSYTVNNFQIQPSARLLYILFLPSWATFPMDQKRKPLSGFSRFPLGCTNLRIGYGNDPNLITENFQNFGIRGQSHDISKKIYFDYLKNRKIFRGMFDELFPRTENEVSLIQAFVIDLKHQLSIKTETLTIECTFSGTTTSPLHQQILCISVHTDGKAICRYAGNSSDFQWHFNHTS